jgi:hypothetical protein
MKTQNKPNFDTNTLNTILATHKNETEVRLGKDKTGAWQGEKKPFEPVCIVSKDKFVRGVEPISESREDIVTAFRKDCEIMGQLGGAIHYYMSEETMPYLSRPELESLGLKCTSSGRIPIPGSQLYEIAPELNISTDPADMRGDNIAVHMILNHLKEVSGDQAQTEQ